MATPNPTEAFMAAYAETLARLERFQANVDDHFGVDPDRIKWGNVGDLGRINHLLAELLGDLG